MVRFATCLTVWVDSSWFSVNSVVGTIGITVTDAFVVVGVRVYLTTLIFTNIFVGVILVPLSSIDDTGFGSDPGFCSNDMSVWVSQDLVLWLVASQCLFASRLELPNHSTLIPFQDATKSVYMCPLQIGFID